MKMGFENIFEFFGRLERYKAENPERELFLLRGEFKRNERPNLFEYFYAAFTSKPVIENEGDLRSVTERNREIYLSYYLTLDPCKGHMEEDMAFGLSGLTEKVAKVKNWDGLSYVLYRKASNNQQ